MFTTTIIGFSISDFSVERILFSPNDPEIYKEPFYSLKIPFLSYIYIYILLRVYDENHERDDIFTRYRSHISVSAKKRLNTPRTIT